VGCSEEHTSIQARECEDQELGINEKQNNLVQRSTSVVVDPCFLKIGVLGPFSVFSTDILHCGSYLLGRAFGRKYIGRLFQVEEVKVELVDVDVVVRMKRDCKVDVVYEWRVGTEWEIWRSL
jgi:hypothetical protein